MVVVAISLGWVFVSFVELSALYNSNTTSIVTRKITSGWSVKVVICAVLSIVTRIYD